MSRERELRHHLARHLEDLGALRSPAWRRCFEVVPRHRLIPRFRPYVQGRLLEEIDATRPDSEAAWIEYAYRDLPAITRVDERGYFTSSSSMPSLMARMLKLLEVRDGDTVLEIGTGTGYNAALLCERLGSEQVTSIDIQADLVEEARGRLAELGYHPHLAIAGGLRGPGAARGRDGQRPLRSGVLPLHAHPALAGHRLRADRNGLRAGDRGSRVRLPPLRARRRRERGAVVPGPGPGPRLPRSKGLRARRRSVPVVAGGRLLGALPGREQDRAAGRAAAPVGPGRVALRAVVPAGGAQPRALRADRDPGGRAHPLARPARLGAPLGGTGRAPGKGERPLAQCAARLRLPGPAGRRHPPASPAFPVRAGSGSPAHREPRRPGQGDVEGVGPPTRPPSRPSPVITHREWCDLAGPRWRNDPMRAPQADALAHLDSGGAGAAGAGMEPDGAGHVRRGPAIRRA